MRKLLVLQLALGIAMTASVSARGQSAPPLSLISNADCTAPNTPHLCCGSDWPAAPDCTGRTKWSPELRVVDMVEACANQWHRLRCNDSTVAPGWLVGLGICTAAEAASGAPLETVTCDAARVAASECRSEWLDLESYPEPAKCVALASVVLAQRFSQVRNSGRDVLYDQKRRQIVAEVETPPVD